MDGGMDRWMDGWKWTLCIDQWWIRWIDGCGMCEIDVWLDG